MDVLRATLSKKNQLHGYTNKVSRLEFAQDADGNFVIGPQCADDPDFAAIQTDLKAMAKIAYKPKVEVDAQADGK